MFRFNERDLISWIAGNYPVKSVKGKEVNFPCPYCNHPSFYFNVEKQIGWCHRAKCHRKVKYKDLLDIVGYEPEAAGYIPELDNPREGLFEEPDIIHLPFGSWPIITKDGIEKDSWVVETLKHRGVSSKDIIIYNIHAHKNWIYVPVYDNEILVQYVGRRINRLQSPKNGFSTQKPKYDYMKGVDISKYLFGWEEAKNWDKLTIVENTFNSIWLRDYLNCTTVFGSYVSPFQLMKIARSKIKHVAILFDEGAEKSAQKTANSLNNLGIAADYIKIFGQPDSYPKEHLKELVDATRK